MAIARLRIHPWADAGPGSVERGVEGSFWVVLVFGFGGSFWAVLVFGFGMILVLLGVGASSFLVLMVLVVFLVSTGKKC